MYICIYVICSCLRRPLPPQHLGCHVLGRADQSPCALGMLGQTWLGFELGVGVGV